MKKLILALVATATLTPLWVKADTGAPTPANMDTDKVVSTEKDTFGRQKMDDGWFTGPLVASNASAVGQGHWLFQPYLIGSMVNNSFDNNGNIRGSTPNGSNSIIGLALIQYGVTDNFTIGLIPQGIYNVNNGPGSSSGPQFGDLTFEMDYMFTKFKEGEWWPTTALQFQQTFPTGQYTNLDRPENGVGGGSYVSKISVLTQYYFWVNDRILRMRVNGSYATGTDVDIENTSSYGTVLGKGRVYTGDNMTASVSFEYSLTQNWVPAIDFVYTHSDNTSVHSSTDYDTGSSENFSIAPAMEYNFSDSVGMIFGVQFTAAGRNTYMEITPQISVCCFF